MDFFHSTLKFCFGSVLGGMVVPYCTRLRICYGKAEEWGARKSMEDRTTAIPNIAVSALPSISVVAPSLLRLLAHLFTSETLALQQC